MIQHSTPARQHGTAITTTGAVSAPAAPIYARASNMRRQYRSMFCKISRHSAPLNRFLLSTPAAPAASYHYGPSPSLPVYRRPIDVLTSKQRPGPQGRARPLALWPMYRLCRSRRPSPRRARTSAAHTHDGFLILKIWIKSLGYLRAVATSA